MKKIGEGIRMRIVICPDDVRIIEVRFPEDFCLLTARAIKMMGGLLHQGKAIIGPYLCHVQPVEELEGYYLVEKVEMAECFDLN